MADQVTRRVGFSLIELLIVIAVIGILVALVGVGSRGLLDRGRLSESVNHVTTAVEDARRRAKRLDTTVNLAIAQQDGEWVVSIDGVPRSLGADVTSGAVAIALNPPFGTYAGAQLQVDLGVGSATASVFVTGVLAKTVVQR